MVRGKAAPTAFWNEVTRTRCVFHGDDFAFVGPGKDLQQLTQLMNSWYQMKVRAVLGSRANDDKGTPSLNRLTRWKSDSIDVKADSQNRLLIMEHFGLEEESTALTAPAIKEDVGQDEGESTKEESTMFRRVAAPPNFLAVDWADIRFALMMACRGMWKPGEGDVEAE